MDYLKYFSISILAIFAPIKAVMVTVGILIFGDLILGIWAASKRGENISSAAMRRTISKMFVYQLTIMTGFLLEVYIMQSILPIAKLVAGVIGMVEFKSLLENATVITGTDFQELIKKLGSKNDR